MILIIFFFLLRKGVYFYEYIDGWEKFDETLLSDKESFYSKLNEEGISNKDYAHAQKIWEVFEIKSLGEYHDLYVQCDNYCLQMCLKILEINVIYELDPAYFVSAPGLAWQACLKKTGVKSELLTDYDMLLMVEE